MKIQSAITDIQIPKDAQTRKLAISFIIYTELVRKKKIKTNEYVHFGWDLKVCL